MKQVKLTHAEIVRFYDSEDVRREYKTDKGNTIVSFNIKTKVNDKIDRAPVIFDRCSMFVDNAEKLEFLRNTLSEGARVEIEAIAERNKGKDGNYHDNLAVKKITPYDSAAGSDQTPASEDDLPF